ncbi:hypothetical protein DYB32_005264 [Aphanomyces invadans]|uniref:ZNF598/HEL2 PAH domain-containing protein n=1 Tax=Aphanomyces invadans TaxID=157072 RepID=A0A3R6Z3L7_9STRA|nr:hypothetical protein DYB32_005264 [Aphanomyces invadans]
MRTGPLSACMTLIPFVPLYKTKTFFGQSMKPAFLATRQRDLQEYFARITGIPGVTHFQTPEGSTSLAEFVLVHAHVSFDRPVLGDPSSSLVTRRHASLSNAALPSLLVTPVDDPPRMEVGTPRTSDESSASSSDDELHLTEAQQEELQELIFQRITDHAGADSVKAFQKRARRFGKAAVEDTPSSGVDFYTFMVDQFGIEFCQWLVPSLAALLPDKQKRHALMKAMTQFAVRAQPQTLPELAMLPPTHTTWTGTTSIPAVGGHVEGEAPLQRLSGRVRPASEAAIPSSRGTRTPSRCRPQSLNAKQVLAKVRDLVDGDEARVEEFRHMTKELRAYRTSPAQYAQFVVHSFGADVSKDVLMSVAEAMGDNQIQEDLQAAATAASEPRPSLGASFQHKRELSRRKSFERSQSYSRRSLSITSFGTFEDAHDVLEEHEVEKQAPQRVLGDEEDARDAPKDNKILSRLRHQGAVNLMSFKT